VGTEGSDTGMADLIERKHLPETSFHIRDCHVWAEIYYLDSPTDYRECLPEKKSTLQARGNDLVTLVVATITPDCALALLCVVILLGWLLYIFIDAL
jgi:hypothetical protein